jgi:DNA mismatch repair ATPase MutS
LISDTLVRRYAELKREAPGCVLLMQIGAFMKVLDDDARRVSEVTGLKLQMSGSVDAPVVLGGFQKSGLDSYVGKLVRAGHSVAVAFQNDRKERNLEEVIRVERDGSQGAPRRAEDGDDGPL